MYPSIPSPDTLASVRAQLEEAFDRKDAACLSELSRLIDAWQCRLLPSPSPARTA